MQTLLSRLAWLLLLVSPVAHSATINGSTRAHAGDSTNAFTGGTNNGLTVSCWFKLSIPSSVMLAKDMVVVSNRQGSADGGNFAFDIRFNIATGNVEFLARGATTALSPQVLIAQPFLERWYHVAVTREIDTFIGYLDGRQVFSTTQNIGAVTNSNGITIGGTSDAANLYGEVIEVAVWRRKLDISEITTLLFAEQPMGDADLRGYYKLRKSAVAADQLKNFAPSPPAGTDPLTGAAVTFDDANQAGEQSTFDSHRNGGRDATAPLSGAFSWEHTVFRRPTVGVPFEFKIGYHSGNSGGTGLVSGFAPGAGNGLGGGWTHTFDARLIPSTTFEPNGPPFPLVSKTLGLMLWDGSLEVWDSADDVTYSTRHGEYRGEVRQIGSGANATFEWVTPDRLRYIFYTPFAGAAQLKGRLKEIRDYSGNVLVLAWEAASGRLLTVTDTAGGVWQFTYAGTLLSTVSITFGTAPNTKVWTATFAPTAAAANRLATLTVAGPAEYATTPPIPTTWGFYYRTSVPQTDPTFGLLEKIADPRGYNGGSPSYYDVQLTYDKYGRVIEERDGLARLNATAYGVDHLGAAATRKVTRTDAAGQKWVEEFDRKHRVKLRRDPLGNVTAFELNDATGTVAATVDANSNRTEFTYDARANVLTRRDALLRTTTWEYNATIGTAPNTAPLNKPTKEIRPATAETPLTGWETIYTYDPAGNLLTQSDALGTLVTNTYTGRGQLLTTRDARDFVTSFTYTPEGYLETRTVPDVGNTTRTWTHTYTEFGWLKTETDPLNRTTYFFQNINGQVVSVTDPYGRVFNKTYDASGNLTHDYDAKGIATQHTYDNADQKTQTTTRDGQVWSYFYTPRGELDSTRDPSLPAGNPTARTASYLYDSAGRRTRETDANGFFTESFYDANGNLTRTRDKEGRDWRKTYDKLNRVTTDQDPLGDTTTTAFDAAGRVDTITSPRGFTSRHEYDGRGRLTKWIDAEGHPWLYTYDGNGNITRITDALGGHYDMQYGPRNERRREENQDHYVWLYDYDELLRLKTQTDPQPLAGDPPQTPPVVRTFTYDVASRVEEVTFSTGRRTVFHYDFNNNPEEIRRVVPGQPTSTLTLSYDAMDRVTSALDAFGKTVGYNHDPAGRVKTIVYPGAKTLTHGYDLAGRLTTLTDWAARVSSFGYDRVGRLTTHAYPNGVLDTLSYHEDGTVKKLDYTRAAGGAFTPFALEYAYDRNGNKTQEKKRGVLDWQPGLAAGQVAPFEESYTPTASGRLASSADALNPARNFTYTYNAAGDMTLAASPSQTTAFTYDEDHRVLSVTQSIPPVPAVTTIENRYDALGRRIARKLTPPGAAAVETRYVLDLTGNMERILCDTTATGTVTARYIHGPGGLGYREDASGTLTCFHADAMGNILRLTDATGATTAEYAYTPYGRLLATTGSAGNPYRFVGAQGVMEELPNLYFMRARYYSADAGVFLSTDPVKNIGPGWSPVAYSYTDGNPMSRIDPDGEFWHVIAGAAAGAIINTAAEAIGIAYDRVALGKNIDRNDVAARLGGAFVGGAVEGAVTALAPGAGRIAGKALGNLAQDLVEQSLDDDVERVDFKNALKRTVFETTTDVAIGGVFDRKFGHINFELHGSPGTAQIKKLATKVAGRRAVDELVTDSLKSAAKESGKEIGLAARDLVRTKVNAADAARKGVITSLQNQISRLQREVSVMTSASNLGASKSISKTPAKPKPKKKSR